MLAAAGLHADPVLIGAGIRFNPAVPSPAAFNHLITYLTLPGTSTSNPVWLDSTTEVAPWRALLPVIRDQQALLIPATAPAEIVRTPANLPYPAVSTSSVTGTLDASLTSDSTIVLTFHDDTEIALRAVLRNVSPSDYGAFVQNLMANLGFGGTTSDPVLDHLNDDAQPLSLRFHYHRVRDASWGENRITATFLPVALPAFTPEKPPTSAIQLGSPRSETSTVEITLPAGWTVALPAPVHAVTPFVTCDVTFHVRAGKLFEERKLVVLQKEVPVSSSRQYQSWYDAAGISGTPFLQLVVPPKATASTGHTAPNLPPLTASAAIPPSDPKAADLVQQAGEKIRNLDPVAARKLLDQAKALNPTERGLWMGYGAIASQFGAPTEALEELRRELAYHPEEAQLYAYIVQEQNRRGDKTGALATTRAWVAAAPASPEASLALAQQLYADGQYATAATEAQSALDRLAKAGATPRELAALRIALAYAQDKLGQKAAAAATVAPLLGLVTDPVQVNTVAYTLAEADRELPAAEAALRLAITSMEDQTTGWTFDDPPALVNRQQINLADAWDTLGWILQKGGHHQDALAYLEAAAHLRPDQEEIRNHLAVTATALKVSALIKPSEQALRTLPLGPAHGRHGTADLRLLLADGKVIATAPPASGISHAGPVTAPALINADQLLKAADLHSLLPPNSHAHLDREAIVNCANNTCQLILIPLGDR